jgi:hypothetical protein
MIDGEAGYSSKSGPTRLTMFRASEGWNVSFDKTLPTYHPHEIQLLA